MISFSYKLFVSLFAFIVFSWSISASSLMICMIILILSLSLFFVFCLCFDVPLVSSVIVKTTFLFFALFQPGHAQPLAPLQADQWSHPAVEKLVAASPLFPLPQHFPQHSLPLLTWRGKQTPLQMALYSGDLQTFSRWVAPLTAGSNIHQQENLVPWGF